MTMTLDPDVEAEILRLARLTGKPASEIVRDAIVARSHHFELAPSGRPTGRTPDAVRIAVERARLRLRALPILDTRTPDEMLGYDDNGLPG